MERIFAVVSVTPKSEIYKSEMMGSNDAWQSIFVAETIKVYDGYSSLRKRLFRTITVNKMCSKDDLLMTAMRAFVVTQDPRNFYLLDVYQTSQSGEPNADGGSVRDEEILVNCRRPTIYSNIFIGRALEVVDFKSTGPLCFQTQTRTQTTIRRPS